MDRFRSIQVLIAVAEEEGFAPAAKRLGMSPPAVTRAVAALEEHLGVHLFRRTTRVVRLTEVGARFLADSRRILEELAEAEASAAGAHSALRGQIAVTAPSMFGRLFVAPIAIDFLARHPEVGVRTLLVDRVVDLLEEGIDVAVRIAHLPDSSLTAIQVGSMRHVVCAAPSYLVDHGVPKKPADLLRMEAIDFSFSVPQRQWAFPLGGRTRIVRPPARFFASSAEVAVAAAVAGQGIARLLAYQVEQEVRAGTLQIVLADYEPLPIPVHVVHVEGRRAAARVRAFVDLAVERMRAETWLS
jgi:DNA-binding transcriptional LysR family regulator